MIFYISYFRNATILYMFIHYIIHIAKIGIFIEMAKRHQVIYT